MMALLAKWQSTALVVLAAVAVLALGWVRIERAEKAELAAILLDQRGQIDQAIKANAGLEATLAELRAVHAQQISALARNAAQAAARSARIHDIREEVRDAPKTEDGSVAPVLSHALERLRRARAAPSGRATDGTTEPATHPSDLRGQP
jgi:hypothetical protein